MTRHLAVTGRTGCGSPLSRTARACAGAALIVLGFGAGTASAQTIIVKDAPAGATVELVVNNAVVATDTANANGRVTLVVPGTARPDMDALVSVDTCGTRRRILFTQPSIAVTAADAACVRRDVPGLFVVRGVSTIVFNVEGPYPRLLLRQGPFNPDAPPRTWAAVPSGLMVSGGVGFGGVGNVFLQQCGSAPECSDDSKGFSLSGGAEFWFGRFVAVEVGYLKPALASTEGSDTDYSFTSELDVRLVTLGAKAGGSTGPVRIFGRGGVNKHRSLSTISQKINDTSITIDEVTTAIPGGTQVIQVETEGYGWYVGVGLELWLNRHVAPYLGFDYQKIKGSDRGEGEALMNDRHLSANIGIRLRLGK